MIEHPPRTAVTGRTAAEDRRPSAPPALATRPFRLLHSDVRRWGASLDTSGAYCSVLREHFLVRAQLSSRVEVRMPRTRLAACLAGAVIIALAGCGTGSGGGGNGDSASGR